MTPKDAIGIAKTYVSDLYADEGLVNLGLEELEFDDGAGQWRVTLGFSRLWSPAARLAASLSGDPLVGRSFKVVTVSDRDGRVISLKNREVEPI